MDGNFFHRSMPDTAGCAAKFYLLLLHLLLCTVTTQESQIDRAFPTPLQIFVWDLPF
jgi:hypothetical protein